MNDIDFSEQVSAAVKVMRAGGVILYPTDTIWGIGCDATNAAAVAKVYEIKRRLETKSMIVLMDRVDRIQNYVRSFPDIAWDLVDLAVEPLTVIYSDAKNLAENIVADDGSIGIRVTREAFSRRLCELMRVPVVSTSANVSGEPAPSCFAEISQEIIAAVDFVVDYRRDDSTKAKPSSIIKLGPKGEVKVIRQ